MGVGLGVGVAVGSGVGVAVGIAVAVGSGCSGSLVGVESVEPPQATPATITIASAIDIAHGFKVILIDPQSLLLPVLCPFPVVARSIVVSPVSVNTPFPIVPFREDESACVIPFRGWVRSWIAVRVCEYRLSRCWGSSQ